MQFAYNVVPWTPPPHRKTHHPPYCKKMKYIWAKVFYHQSTTIPPKAYNIQTLTETTERKKKLLLFCWLLAMMMLTFSLMTPSYTIPLENVTVSYHNSLPLVCLQLCQSEYVEPNEQLFFYIQKLTSIMLHSTYQI